MRNLPTWEANAGKYVITVRARDKAGNVQDTFEVNLSSRAFMSDNAGPLSRLTYPVSVVNTVVSTNSQSLANISGTALDNYAPYCSSMTGTNKVYLEISNETGGTYWSGSVWGAVITALCL